MHYDGAGLHSMPSKHRYKLIHTRPAPQLPLSTPLKLRPRCHEPREKEVEKPRRRREIAAEASISSVPGTKQKKQLEYMIQKATSDLPDNLRTPVDNLFHLVLNASAHMEEKVTMLNRELSELRAEHKRVCLERNRMVKSNQALRDAKALLEDRLDTAVREDQHKSAAVSKYRHLLERVKAHNKTLQLAVSSMSVEEDRELAEESLSAAESLTAHDSIAGSTTTASMTSHVNLAGSVFQSSVITSMDKSAAWSKRERFVSAFHSATRELTVLSRKNALLEQKNEELSAQLLQGRSKIRSLKQCWNDHIQVCPLSESLQLSACTDNDHCLKTKKARSVQQLIDRVDEQLNGLIQDNAIDVMELVSRLRCIQHAMICLFDGLLRGSFTEALFAKNTCTMMDCEAVILIQQTDTGSIVRFSAGETQGQKVSEAGTEMSALLDVLNSAELLRLNDVSRHPRFNNSIDTCRGLPARSMHAAPLLACPSHDKAGGYKVLGVVAFLNKRHGKFTELDDVIATLFASQLSKVVLAARHIEEYRQHSHLCLSLLGAGRNLLDAYHPGEELDALSQTLRVSDILRQLQVLVHQTLRSRKCRVFIVEPHHLRGGGALLFSDDKEVILAQRSGIAEHVRATKQMYFCSHASNDQWFNDQVDIDPLAWPLVVAPILSLEGECLGIFEVVPSVASPPLPPSAEGDYSGANSSETEMLMSSCCHWLSQQLAPSLQYYLLQMGTVTRRSAPASPSPTPTRSSKCPVVDTSSTDFHKDDSAKDLSTEAPPKLATTTTATTTSSTSPPSLPVNVDWKLPRTDTQLQPRPSEHKRLQLWHQVGERADAGKLSEQLTSAQLLKQNEVITVSPKTKHASSVQIASGLQGRRELSVNKPSGGSARANRDQTVDEHTPISSDSMMLTASKTMTEGGRQADQTAQVATTDDIPQLIKLPDTCETEKATLGGIEQSGPVEIVMDETCYPNSTSSTEKNSQDMSAVKGADEPEPLPSVSSSDNTASSTDTQQPIVPLEELVLEAAVAANHDHAMPQAVTHPTQVHSDQQDGLHIEVNDGTPRLEELGQVPALNDLTAASANWNAEENFSAGDDEQPTRQAHHQALEQQICVWEMLTDESGTQYYFNSATNESSWEYPEHQHVCAGEWMSQFDAEGHMYWMHQTTRELSWEVPTTTYHAPAPASTQGFASVEDYVIEL